MAPRISGNWNTLFNMSALTIAGTPAPTPAGTPSQLSNQQDTLLVFTASSDSNTMTVQAEAIVRSDQERSRHLKSLGPTGVAIHQKPSLEYSLRSQRLTGLQAQTRNWKLVRARSGSLAVLRNPPGRAVRVGQAERG